MAIKIIKRNGTIVPFDFNKIKNAVNKAFQAVYQCDAPNDFINYLEVASLTFENEMSVEDIQKFVIYSLGEFKYYDVQIAYIKYKETHSEIRFIKDRVDWINHYMESSDNAASSSETDANANVAIKNVANIDGESYKAINRQIQRYRMTKQLKKQFPEVADQYIKDLEHHIIYTHDESSSPAVKNYCEAVSLYPLLIDGTKGMDGLGTTAPKNLNAFCGQLVNLTFLLSAQCKGAVAFGEFFNFLDYFCTKDFGENYHKEFEEIASLKPKRRVIDAIHQAYQQIVYGWNQPAGNRSYQSPFENISYYDEYYWHALFDDFYFPDGTQPKWERVNWLQKDFMQWFNTERTKTLLTFPVETVALLSENGDIKDKDWKEFTAEMYSKGHSFFTYVSDNPNALASCCFSKDQKVLWKSSTTGVHLTTLEELHNTKWEPEKKNLKIFHNGSWINGKSIKLPNREMYKIKTFNNKCFYMTDNHINVTLKGEKQTSELTTDDYLMFNTLPLQAIPENDERLTYSQGFVVGAFLGDGSFGAEQKGIVYSINFSQNAEKYEKMMYHINIANQQVGGSNKSWLGKVYNNVYPVEISSKELAAFIIKWTNWYRGTYAYNKSLNLNCLLQSYEFRKGILDGWYNTDGGNSNRCYTTSPELAEDMEVLITSLGMQSIINISDRTDEDVIIRGEIYDRNYPLYCVRWYEPGNHRSNKDIENSWIKFNNSIYFKIKSIEKVEYTDDVYCIECKNQEEPYFTLPSGLITHNCRLRNEIAENVFSFTNGLTGVQTGSANVITLNLNRIVQDYCHLARYKQDCLKYDDKDVLYAGLREYLIDILERVYKYHIAYKTMLYEVEKAGMLNASIAGYISMHKLFSTIGINGLNEAAEFLGLKCNYNEDYKNFCRLITGTISEQNRIHSSVDFQFNTELVPAEGLSSKNYNWDKEDKYWVPADRNLFNSYFYIASDPNTSILERFKLHGREFTGLLDGGVGLHCNLDEHLSKEQYLKLIDFAIKNGTSYFTFNIPNSECDDCHYITKTPIMKCPKCGSEHITQWTRVIGFMRPIKMFDKERYKEALTRVYHPASNLKC